MKITPDLIISVLLGIASIVGLVMDAQTEVLIGLISGLTGYLGKSAQDALSKSQHTDADIKAAVGAALQERGIGGNVADMIAQNSIDFINGKKEEKP